MRFKQVIFRGQAQQGLFFQGRFQGDGFGQEPFGGAVGGQAPHGLARGTGQVQFRKTRSQQFQANCFGLPQGFGCGIGFGRVRNDVHHVYAKGTHGPDVLLGQYQPLRQQQLAVLSVDVLAHDHPVGDILDGYLDHRVVASMLGDRIHGVHLFSVPFTSCAIAGWLVCGVKIVIKITERKALYVCFAPPGGNRDGFVI